jgi:hypothetical protein
MKSVLILGVLISSIAMAKTPADLKLSCQATYKVLEENKFYKPPHYRVNGYDGVAQKLQVLKISGKDCDKLFTYYDLNLKVGEIVGDGQIPSGAHFTGYGENLGKTLIAKTSQSFTYDHNGELPLYPLVHSESAHLLKTGTANSKELYGTPALEDLTDQQKNVILEKLLWILDHGKNIDSWSPFFTLLLKLDMHDMEKQQEYLNSLLLAFKNMAKANPSVTTLSSPVMLGGKINTLLNTLGGTKWQTALEVYQQNPMLLNSSVLSSLGNNAEAPNLSTEDIEAYLAYAYTVAKQIEELPNFMSKSFLYQYKESAKSLKMHSTSSPNTFWGPRYELNAISLELIESILKL